MPNLTNNEKVLLIVVVLILVFIFLHKKSEHNGYMMRRNNDRKKAEAKKKQKDHDDLIKEYGSRAHTVTRQPGEYCFNDKQCRINDSNKDNICKNNYCYGKKAVWLISKKKAGKSCFGGFECKSGKCSWGKCV